MYIYNSERQLREEFGDALVDDFLQWMRGQTAVVLNGEAHYSARKVNDYLNDNHELDLFGA